MINYIGLILFVFQFGFIGAFLLGRYKFPVLVKETVQQPVKLEMSEAQFIEFMRLQEQSIKKSQDVQEKAIKDQVKELSDYLSGGQLNYENFNG